MVATTLTRAALWAWSSAAALMPTGKPSEAPIPHSRMPRTTTTVAWPKTIISTPTPAIAIVPQSTGSRPNRSSSTGPTTRPTRHRGHEAGEAEHADRPRDVVAVDQCHREPVVGRALGHRQRQHHHPDQQRPRLQPRPPGGATLGPFELLGRHRQEAPGRPPGQHPHHRRGATQVREHRYADRGGERSDPGAGHGPEGEPRVEARHDRAPETAFDLGALHVHRDVPRADADAVDEEADGGHRHGAQHGDPHRGDDQPGDVGDGAGAHHRGGAEPRDQRAGARHRARASRPRSRAAAAPAARCSARARGAPPGCGRPRWRSRSR